MKINNHIISKRKDLKMTQKELAKKLDVTDKTVSRWERGTTIPDVEMLKKLSIVIGLDINEIFKEIEVNINENEIVDSESIKKYRVGYVSAMSLFIFATSFLFMIKLLSPLNSDPSMSVLWAVFFTIAILMIMGGFITYLISLIKFYSVFTEKEYKRKYLKEITISAVVLTLSTILLIFSFIV